MMNVVSHTNFKIDIKSTIFVEEFQRQQAQIDFFTDMCNPTQLVETEPPRELNKIEKCFKAWKKYVYNKKKNFNKELQQSEKLEAFIKSLKNVKQKSLTEDENKLERRPKQYAKESQFMHRFQAQKEIIQMQKQKLNQQQNMINQLKLGNLDLAIDESMEQTKKNVTEIMRNCSVKVRCKIKSNVFLENINKDLLELGIKSDKVPKIIREMERRAVDRERRRQLISERKKILDATKKKAIENEILEKTTQDEEKRRQCMEELQKRREAQLKFYRQVKINRERMLHNTAIAKDFYEKKLKQFTINALRRLIQIKNDNFIKSKVYYEIKLIRKGFKYWKQFITEIEYKRNYNALQLYNGKMKKKLFFGWFKIYVLSIQHLQVAEDFYTMQLERRMFHRWSCYTYTQQYIETKNTQKALRHYQNWILLHYFYQWRALPAILIIERAKEEKKRKWREKVWEILPDYKPVIDNSF
ncbi:hypothetical protein FQR65_LT06164 [Abscondita terminalis]|nr:hypothetical protein FQR65_LT06164 [Abscondita terminalis]